MNKIFTAIALLFSIAAGALPPAGTPSFAELVKQSSAYTNAIQSFNLTEEPVIEQISHYGEDLTQDLKEGTCKSATLSKSGSLARVTIRTSDKNEVFYFGSASSLAEDAVLCQ